MRQASRPVEALTVFNRAPFTAYFISSKKKQETEPEKIYKYLQDNHQRLFYSFTDQAEASWHSPSLHPDYFRRKRCTSVPKEHVKSTSYLDVIQQVVDTLQELQQ